jgi:RNA polymerase sigma factor (sigma-70 family)
MGTGPGLQELETLHGRSFAWCLVCCRGDRSEAEEVLQTVYLKVLDGRASHEGRGELKPWLFAVIRRTAADRRRRAALSRLWFRPGMDELEDVADAANPEGDALRGETARRIRAVLDALSRRQRQVLELVFFHDLSLRDAAGVLGLTVGAVRRHYHRGKLRARAELEKGGQRCPTTTNAS